MQASGQPQYPPHEELHYQIDDCITHPQLWVLPNNGSNEPVFRQTEVVKRHNATQTYQIIKGIAPRELSHGGPVWGYLYVAVVLPRRASDLLYQEPTAETVQRVIIKKLFKDVVHEDLRRGSEENPYKEVYRMQSIGDNFHVLGCTEALQDEKYLYIIAPYCARQSLGENIPLKPSPNTATSMEAHARDLFRQMLQDLEYLHERHAICHRDVDPGNFLVSSEGRVMLNDLAMSIVIPPSGLVHPLTRCGKPPYWPPEIYHQHPWYPKQSDLWACVVTLFKMLTGQRLYYLPRPHDVLFRYCIMARGLSRQFGTNELVSEVLGETTATEFLEVSTIAQKIMTLSPQVLELFEHTLALRPDHRWTREQVLECKWMTMPM